MDKDSGPPYTITLSTTYQKLNTDVLVTTVNTTNTSVQTFWNLSVPAGVYGVCAGNLSFLAVGNT
jgi:hypothetical protein